jgi:hypothetical protein
VVWYLPKPAPWALDLAATERPDLWQGAVVLPFWEGRQYPRRLGRLTPSAVAVNAGTEGTDWNWTRKTGFGAGWTITTAGSPQPRLLAIGDDADIFSSLTRGTVLMVRVPADTTNRENGTWGNENPGGIGQRFSTNAPWSDGNIYFDFGGTSNGTTRVQWIGGYSKSTTALDIFAFRAGPRGMSIWYNGEQKASHGTAASRSRGGNFWLAGEAALGTASDLHTYHFFALIDAEWTDQQIKDWSRDPFIMLRPRSRLVINTATQVVEVATTYTATVGMDAILKRPGVFSKCGT